MPVTALQARILRICAAHRSEDSYLGGSTPLQLLPNSRRFSRDVDFFQDSVARVASAFAADEAALRADGLAVAIRVQQPGFVTAIVSADGDATQVDWAHDSAWRFLPAIRNPLSGFELHPIDLAINKLHALAGRDEPRDFLDMLDLNERVLPLVALCWAAPGKDPGYSPRSILEMLKRRGKFRHEDFRDLTLAQPLDLLRMKDAWLAALGRAEREVLVPPPEERGCLYYSPSAQRFVWPVPERGDAVPHYGRPGGVLPVVYRRDPLVDELRGVTSDFAP